MKAIFNLHRERTAWVAESFPGGNAFFLPVINKVIVEFWLDFCSMEKISEVMILDSEYDPRLAELIGDGTKWALSAVYLGDDTSASLSEVVAHHRAFLPDGEPVLFFNGLFFLHYDQNALPELSPDRLTALPEAAPASDGLLVRLADGSFRAMNEGCAAEVLDSVMGYYNLNFSVLKNDTAKYVVPGYHIEHGIYTGMNNVIPPTCQIDNPALFGDNISLGHDCFLSNVIVGGNVIVDRLSNLHDTLVLPNTYIGAGLEFIGMIVYQNYVIDPKLPVTVNLTDVQLAGKLRPLFSGLHGIASCFGWLIAFLFALVQILPFGVFWFIGMHRYAFRFRFLSGTSGGLRNLYLTGFHHDPGSRLNRWFFALSLDRFSRFLQVLSCRISLVGDFLYDPDQIGVHEFIRDNYINYSPGAFCLSESTRIDNHGGAECLIDDLFRRHNRSFLFDFMILIRSLFRRLLGNYADGK